jgi:hypothetical protein
MTTETLDRLYLEWSQFTRARTSREIALLAALKRMKEDLDHAISGAGRMRSREEQRADIRAALAKAEGKE